MRFVNSLNLLGVYPSNNSFEALHPCPLCNTKDSLSVSSSNGILYVKCKNCNFNNSIFELFKIKLGLNDNELELALKPGGMLCSAVESNEEAEMAMKEYKAFRTKQSDLHDYMLQCHKNLTESAEGTALLSHLFLTFGIAKKKEYLPIQVGLLSKNNIPSCLNSINNRDYLSTPTLIFFYEDLNYIVTNVVIYKVNTEERETITILNDTYGSYLNHTVTNTTKTILVCQSELLATSLFSKYAVRNTVPLPMLVTNKLPINGQALEKIKLITCPKFPISLAKGFLYFDRLTQSNKVTIDIIELPSRIYGLLSQDIAALPSRGKDLTRWLCEKIVKDFGEIGPSKVYESLNSISINKYKKTLLLQELAHVTDNDQLINVVDDAINSNRCFIQSNVHIENIDNNIVRTRPGTRAVLANFGMTVNSVVNSKDGIFYKTTIKTDKFPSVDIKLDSSNCSAQTIKALIRKTFIDLGYNFAVYVKEPNHSIQWVDVLAGFAENRPIIKEVTQLGATSRGEVNFPQFIYNCTDNSVKAQINEIGVNTSIHQMYDGVKVIDTTDSILRKLLATTGSKKLGLVLGVLHLIHQIVSSAYHKRSEDTPFVPKHLVYADIDESFWDDTYRQLFSLLSMTSYIPKISSDINIRTLRKFFDQYTGLGTLPLFVGVPDTLNNKFVDMLYHIENPIVCRAGDPAANFLNREVNVNYVRRTDKASIDLSTFSNEELAEIRSSLPQLIRDIAGIVPFNQITIRETNCPSLFVYDYLCEKLGIKPLPVENYVGCNYDIELNSNLSLFFKTLHDLLWVPLMRGRNYYLAQHENDDRPKSTRIGFREKDNVVLFVHRIVLWVNQRHYLPQKFDIKMLEEKLKDRGLIIEDPHPETRAHKMWVMPSHIYELLIDKLIQLDHVPHPLDMCHTVSQDSYMVSPDLENQSGTQQELIPIGSKSLHQ